MNTACYVGIDVAKDCLDVHIRPLNKTLAVANTAADVAELLVPLQIKKIILKASGGYEELAFIALVEISNPVAIIKPRQVRDFAKGGGSHGQDGHDRRRSAGAVR